MAGRYRGSWRGWRRAGHRRKAVRELDCIVADAGGRRALVRRWVRESLERLRASGGPVLGREGEDL